MSFKTRPSCAIDYNWLLTLHHESYFAVITRQFGSWDKEEQLEMFLKSWHSENLTILLNENKPIGMFIVNNFDKYLWLAELQISPKHQSKGFGSEIVQTLLANARQLNLPLRLRVLFKNHRAKEFYLQQGFISISQTNYHYVMQAS